MNGVAKGLEKRSRPTAVPGMHTAVVSGYPGTAVSGYCTIPGTRVPGILIGYLIRVRVGGARSSRARPGTGFENSFTALQAFYPELTSPGVGLQPLCSPV